MTLNTRLVTSKKRPTNEVTCIDDQAFSDLLLWKDWQTLVVTVVPRPGSYAEKAKTALDCFYELEIIQTVIKELDFRQTNRVYIVGQADGSYRLVYRPVTLLGPSLKCQILAPLVDEKDIEITKWVRWDEWCGRWNGRDVDVMLTRDEESTQTLEKEIEGYKLMEMAGLKDLTLELVGHVVRDGSVVGIMTEPSAGRIITQKDRARVFEAIGRLQSKRLLHRYIHWSNIIVLERGVCFRDLCHLQLFNNDDELAKEAEHWHWEKAEEIFKDVENQHIGGDRYPSAPLAFSFARDIPSIPSIAKPVFGFDGFNPGNIRLHNIIWVEKEAQSRGLSLTSRDETPAHRVTEGCSRTLSRITAADSSSSPDDEKDQSIPPRSTYRIHVRMHPEKHPYRRCIPANRVVLPPDELNE